MKQYLNFNYSKVSSYSLQYHFLQIFHKIELIFFVALSIIFLVASKVSDNFAKDTSYIFIDISMPIVKISAFPFNTVINLLTNFQELIDAKKENESLKAEVAQLQALSIKTININNENDELKNILKFVIPRSTNYKIARVIGRSQGLFSRKLFINEGKNGGINEGDVVTGTIGLIGRIADIEDDKSRLMLPTDANSHIPIVASKARARGILAGTNSNAMEILYLSKRHGIKIGDMIFTSGDGDILPPGLLIGVVTDVDGTSVEVKMAEDINNADIVTVVKY